MSLGKKIEFAMQKKGWEQKELAEKVGKRPPTISRWISDENEPSAKDLLKIAKLTGYPFEWFREPPMTLSELAGVKSPNALPAPDKRISDEEWDLVQLFRRTDDIGRGIILEAAKGQAPDQKEKGAPLGKRR